MEKNGTGTFILNHARTAIRSFIAVASMGLIGQRRKERNERKEQDRTGTGQALSFSITHTPPAHTALRSFIAVSSMELMGQQSGRAHARSQKLTAKA